MRFIVLIIVIAFFGSNLTAKAVLPKTSITLNNKKGCAVHIAAWLSPSCTHCAQYFASDIPKIAQMPGFCLDLHFLPHLYLLDMPIAILIWSQGPANAYKIAELFYKNQSEWLDISSSRDKTDDLRRGEDLEKFYNEIKSDASKDLLRIKDYLEPSDPYLYVKIFALRHFSVKHLERYLPKGRVDANLSMALLDNLPRKSGKAIIFSPAFTDTSGQLLPESQLTGGILTVEDAENILKNAEKAKGPFVPHEMEAPPAYRKVIAKRAAAPTSEEDNDFQDADEEDVVGDDYDDGEVVGGSGQESNDENNLDDNSHEDHDNETTHISHKLRKIIDNQLNELDDGHDIPAN